MRRALLAWRPGSAIDQLDFNGSWTEWGSLVGVPTERRQPASIRRQHQRLLQALIDDVSRQ
jgi:hypothetical protein